MYLGFGRARIKVNTGDLLDRLRPRYLQMMCRSVTPRLLTIALTLIAATACSKRPVAESIGIVDGPGPQFRLIDSLVLEENDTLYLGKPEMGFVVDDSGLIYVADEFWNHVVRFRPNGKIDRVFGRAGDGPGEFRSTTRVAATMDTLVVLASSGRLKVFNRSTGRFYFERTFGRGLLGDVQLHGDHLMLALYDFGSGRGVLSWPLAEFLQQSKASAADPPSANLVDMPPEYSAYPGLREDFGGTSMALWGDTMMVGHDAVNYVVLYTTLGVPLDTIDLPTRVRRGVPRTALPLFARGRQRTLQESAGAISFLVQMWRLPNGEMLLWHQQNRIEQTGEQYKFFGQDFMTLLSADRRRACVDASIPFPGSEWPRLSVHGDTVLALDQIIAGKDSTRGVSVIRRYQIADTHCTWLPVQPRHARPPTS